jgi:hypothetical protein
VTGVGHQEGVNYKVGIASGPFRGAKGGICQRQDVLDHPRCHQRPAEAGAVGEGLRKRIRVSFDRLQLQVMSPDE